MFSKILSHFFVLALAFSSAFLFAPRHNKKLVLSHEQQTLIRNKRNDLAKLDRLCSLFPKPNRIPKVLTSAIKQLSKSSCLSYEEKQTKRLTKLVFNHYEKLHSVLENSQNTALKNAFGASFCTSLLGLTLIAELSKFYQQPTPHKRTIETKNEVPPFAKLSIILEKALDDAVAAFALEGFIASLKELLASDDEIPSSVECSSDDEATSDHEDSRED